MTSFAGLNAMAKQKVVIKFLKATEWDKKLQGFVSAFEASRSDLDFALSMSTAKGINQVQTEYVFSL
jgi:hypothetical protein